MKNLLTLASGVLVVIFVATASYSESGTFITAMPKADLTVQQAASVAAIEKLPTTRDMQVVRLNPDALQPNARLTVPLEANSSVQVQGTGRVEKTGGGFEWSGRTVDGSRGEATLIVNGQNVTGSITTNTGLVRIRPLGGGLHALIRVENKNFPRDEPYDSGAPG